MEKRTAKAVPVRQGDLLFEPIDSDGWEVKHLTKSQKEHGFRQDGVIQEGEATGHHHKVDPTKADVYRPTWGNPIIVVGNEGVDVIHGGSTEVDDRFHGKLFLEPDTAYKVKIAREEDPTGETRQVID